MNNGGLIATIIGFIVLAFTYLFGRYGKSSADKVKEARAEAKVSDIEKASSRIVAEKLSDLMVTEAERNVADSQLTQMLTNAKTDEDLLKFAQLQAERAAQRIKDRSNR